MPYTRPWMSFPDQLQQLIDRGRQVSDPESAISYLDRIGYYRLSGLDQPPSEYFPVYWERLTPKEQADQAYWHALPEGWEEMEYKDFLEARREGIAKIIADGFDRLTNGEFVEVEEDTYQNRIDRGEGMQIEFKSTLRVNLHTGQPDPKMEHAVMKTLAAFLNSLGETLFVGVNDESEVVGLDQDQFPNDDKMLLHLDELIKGRLGGAAFACLKPEIAEIEGKKFLAVECKPSKKPVFLKTGNEEIFHIRAAASSPALPGKQALDYIQQHFK